MYFNYYYYKLVFNMKCSFKVALVTLVPSFLTNNLGTLGFFFCFFFFFEWIVKVS